MYWEKQDFKNKITIKTALLPAHDRTPLSIFSFGKNTYTDYVEICEKLERNSLVSRYEL